MSVCLSVSDLDSAIPPPTPSFNDRHVYDFIDAPYNVIGSHDEKTEDIDAIPSSLIWSHIAHACSHRGRP